MRAKVFYIVVAVANPLGYIVGNRSDSTLSEDAFRSPRITLDFKKCLAPVRSEHWLPNSLGKQFDMRCLHPFCPLKRENFTWGRVVELLPLGKTPAAKKATIAKKLIARFSSPPARNSTRHVLPEMPKRALQELLLLCPCLFNQCRQPCTARGIVHLCEITLDAHITGLNVHDAFLVQHPKREPPFAYPPAINKVKGGDIMEMLCSEILTNAGIPPMETNVTGWPTWEMPRHILLNHGKMQALKAFGDILIPCGPTNVIISVKSEAARERLLYSSNSIEGVGFGFFSEPKEFWTTSRMNLYKRMGFSAIYMPTPTYAAVMEHIDAQGTVEQAVNVNGTKLYRELRQFPDDMNRIVGRHSLLL